MPLTFQKAMADDWIMEPTYGYVRTPASQNLVAFFGGFYYDKQTGGTYRCDAGFAGAPAIQDHVDCYKLNITNAPSGPLTIVPGDRFFPTAPAALSLGGTAIWASNQAIWITGSTGPSLTICFELQGNVEPRCKQATFH